MYVLLKQLFEPKTLIIKESAVLRKSLLSLLCCPEDGSDLELCVISVDGDDVVSGVLECKSCGEVWTIIHAIPRFVSPSSVDLHLDSEFVEENRRAIDDAKPGLADRITAKIARLAEEGKKEEFSWNREEMVFWEKDYENRFHNDVTNKTTFNRILPRKKYIMDPLCGKEVQTILEVGCGTCGTMYNSPEFLEGRHFIGTDLSFYALRTGRKFVPGDFVMCEATKLPFKDHAVDVLLSFGLLHHLELREKALPLLFSKVVNEGYLGLTEKLKSKIDFEKSLLLRKLKERMNPEEHRGEEHEEFIDDAGALRISQEHGDLISKRYEYSAVRDVLVKVFVDRLGLNNRAVAGLIMRLDYCVIDCLRFVSPLFHGNSLVLLVKKSPQAREA